MAYPHFPSIVFMGLNGELSDYRFPGSVAYIRADLQGDENAASVQAIQAIVCEIFQITRTELLSQRRTATIVNARRMGMWLCRSLTSNGTTTMIGRLFGNKDHAVAVVGCRQFESGLRTNPELRRTTRDAMERLGVDRVLIESIMRSVDGEQRP